MLGDQLYFLFLVLALVFGALSLRDYMTNARTMTPAARVRLRMASIFLVIGLFLLYQSIAD